MLFYGCWVSHVVLLVSQVEGNLQDYADFGSEITIQSVCEVNFYVGTVNLLVEASKILQIVPNICVSMLITASVSQRQRRSQLC